MKKTVGKYGIYVWGWPTLLLCFMQLALMACFKLTSANSADYFLEPGSGREVAFEIIIGFLFTGYLWMLVYRYSKMSKMKLSRVVKGGVIFLTSVFAFGIIFSVLQYFK